MAKERFRCRHCRKLRPRRTPDQRYCSDEACQKARKNAWRRERYAADPDYRLNLRDSTMAWLDANGGAAEYHRRYRQARKQRRREQSRAKGEAKPVDSASSPGQAAGANSDALLQESPSISGTYVLFPLGGANSDAVHAEIRVISPC